MTAEDTPDTPRDFKTRLRVLYTGWSRHSARFRYALLTFDLFTVAFFILTAPVASKPWVHGIELGLGVIILADFVARFWISERRWHHATRLWVMADALVLASIFLHTLLPVDLSFLRVLRLLRIGHSPELMIDLRRVSTWFRLRDDAMLALVNLVTFVWMRPSSVATTTRSTPVTSDAARQVRSTRLRACPVAPVKVTSGLPGYRVDA